MVMRKKKLEFGELAPEVRIQFESLKTTILVAGNKQAMRSILFSSYHHGEGTSTVATNFAQSLAQDKKKKILLVDANTRTPSLEPVPGSFAAADHVVFGDLFSQHVEKWVLPKPPPDGNLSLIQSGNRIYHPSQVFDHDRFGMFMHSVTKLFDFVIFDSSPVGRYYDSIVLAPHADGTVLVVQAESTSYHEVDRAKQMFENAKARIIGAVLNRRKFHIPGFIFRALFH